LKEETGRRSDTEIRCGLEGNPFLPDGPGWRKEIINFFVCDMKEDTSARSGANAKKVFLGEITSFLGRPRFFFAEEANENFVDKRISILRIHVYVCRSVFLKKL
jgi:hypothetical protein